MNVIARKHCALQEFNQHERKTTRISQKCQIPSVEVTNLYFRDWRSFLIRKSGTIENFSKIRSTLLKFPKRFIEYCLPQYFINDMNSIYTTTKFLQHRKQQADNHRLRIHMRSAHKTYLIELVKIDSSTGELPHMRYNETHKLYVLLRFELPWVEVKSLRIYLKDSGAGICGLVIISYRIKNDWNGVEGHKRALNYYCCLLRSWDMMKIITEVRIGILDFVSNFHCIQINIDVGSISNKIFELETFYIRLFST